MADIGIRDHKNRKVNVSRQRLIEKLKENRSLHVKEYEEALAGYKSSLIQKIEEGFNTARQKLNDRFTEIRSSVEKFTDDDILNQSDTLTLFDRIFIKMEVPRSYAKEYDAAIDIFEWEEAPSVELTQAEFVCFVRNEWDWTENFSNISKMYRDTHK